MTQAPGSLDHAQPTHRSGRGRLILLVLLLTGATLGAVYHWRGWTILNPDPATTQADRSSSRNRVPPVTVALVDIRDIPQWLTAIGTAVPRQRVNLHSRVDGELLRLHFTEGEMVKAGQLLAELDPRPFQAQLTQINGQLTRDQALLQNARLDLERYRDLWSKDSISKQLVDTQAALVRQHEGTVENDQGLLAQARLQLGYTRITAPISGRISLRQLDPGNQVRAGDGAGLATIAQLEPMNLVFAVPEQQLPRINRRLQAGEVLVTEAWDRAQQQRLAVGRLLTTDNQIDPTTGTIKLKAECDNADRQLFPNQFVNVRLLLDVRRQATTIPAAALIRAPQGTLVYRVNADNEATAVKVTPGVVDGDTVEVTGALAAGERIIVDGSDKVRDGNKVEVISTEPSPPSPAGRTVQDDAAGDRQRHRRKSQRDGTPPARPGDT